MLRLNQLVGFGGKVTTSGDAPPSAYVTSVEDSSPTASTEETYGSTFIGTPHAGRTIGLLIQSGFSCNSSPSAVTVNGVSMTKDADYQVSTVMNNSAWYGAVPSGTSVDVKITWGASPGANAVFHVFEVHGMQATPYDGAGETGTAAVDIDINTKNNGYVCACGQGFDGTDLAITWTNADEVVEGFMTNLNYSAADFNPTSDETPRTITCNVGTPRGGAALSFQP